jgi:uncharacterized protein YsxB (DUF464 family)
VITLRFYAQQELPCGFQATGHADMMQPDATGNHSYDLACCAISVVLQQLIVGLKAVVEVDMELEQQKGILHCRWDPHILSDKQRNQVQVLVETAYLFLEQLHEYKAHFNVDLIKE